MQPISKISITGLGYIGLPTAAVFASRRIEVVGVDVNKTVVDTINRGEIHIVEPDLDIAVHAAVTQGYLRATTTHEPADAFLVAVPTPFTGDGHEPDLQYVEAAARAIAPVLRPGNLVILESTSPVGTTDRMAEWLASARPDLTFPQDCGEDSDIRVAHCPERVLPGKVMQELIANDRVIGGMTPKCSSLASDLYRVFVKGNCVITNSRTAEMVKLTENSFRDVNIAFANELSMICDKMGIDVWELVRLANLHPRVSILQPGPGVGGHCIAVDPWFIVSSCPELSPLIRTARQVNDAKPGWVLERVREAVAHHCAVHPGSSAADIRIACFGLTFKADIDDMRESPALEIVKRVAAEHAGQVLAVEPNIRSLPEELSGVNLVPYQEACQSCDIAVLLVDHSAFKHGGMDFGQGVQVIDTKGIWNG